MTVFLGKGVALWRGEVGSCPDCPKVGGGGGGGKGGGGWWHPASVTCLGEGKL